jgi:hypothetical protein
MIILVAKRIHSEEIMTMMTAGEMRRKKRKRIIFSMKFQFRPKKRKIRIKFPKTPNGKN